MRSKRLLWQPHTTARKAQRQNSRLLQAILQQQNRWRQTKRNIHHPIRTRIKEKQATNPMNLKVLTTVKTKKQLTALYLTQYSERRIRTYINDIIAQYRPNEPTKCRNISIQEFLTFVELYGTPKGHTLSPELQEELKNRKLKV